MLGFALVAAASALLAGCDSRTGLISSVPPTDPTSPKTPVQGPTLTRLQIRPDSLLVRVGSTGTLQVVGTMSDGSTTTLADVTFSSDNSGVVLVDQAGIVSPVTAGRAFVTATKGTLSTTAPIVVLPKSLAHIDVKPDLLCVRAGYGYQFVMHQYDDAGVEITPGPTQWSSTNSALATIDAAGKMSTPLGVSGHVTILGSAGGFTDATDVFVDPAPIGTTMTCR